MGDPGWLGWLPMYMVGNIGKGISVNIDNVVVRGTINDLLDGQACPGGIGNTAYKIHDANNNTYEYCPIQGGYQIFDIPPGQQAADVQLGNGRSKKKRKKKRKSNKKKRKSRGKNKSKTKRRRRSKRR